MSLYSMRAKTVNGGQITLSNGDVVYAIGNREFFAGDMVWTDGKFAYGFQGRGGAMVWNGEEGIPLILNYRRAAWLNSGLKISTNYNIGSGLFSNNKSKLWFFARNYYYSNADSYTDSNGLTAVFVSGFSSINFGHTLKEIKGEKIPYYNTEISINDHTSETNPETNGVDEDIRQADVFSIIPLTMEWEDNAETIRVNNNKIIIYDQERNVVKETLLINEDELRSWANVYGNISTNFLTDAKITNITVTIENPRIDSGKIYYEQRIAINTVGIVKAVQIIDTYTYTKKIVFRGTKTIENISVYGIVRMDNLQDTVKTEQYEYNDLQYVPYEKSGTVGVNIESYVEANFDINTGRLSEKKETIICKTYSPANGSIVQTVYPTIEGDRALLYTPYYHELWHRFFIATNDWCEIHEDSGLETFYPCIRSNTVEKYTTVEGIPESETYISDKRSIKYLLQDNLSADRNGNIYDNGALVLKSGLDMPRAAVKIGKTEWLIIAGQSEYSQHDILFHIKDGVTARQGTVTNSKLHKFKAIKKFLNSAN